VLLILAALAVILPPPWSSLALLLVIAGPVGGVTATRRADLRTLVITRRGRLAVILALLAVILLALATYAFRPQPESLIHYRPTRGPEVYYAITAPWLLVGGWLVLLAALALTRRLPSFPVPLAAPLTTRRSRWRWPVLLVGVLLLGAFAEINGWLLGIEMLAGRSPHTQFVLLVGGIVCLVVGFSSPLPTFGRHPLSKYGERTSRSPDSSSPRVERGPEGEVNTKPAQQGAYGNTPLRATLGGSETRPYKGFTQSRFAELALLLLLTGFALGVRFWNLGESVRVLVDEGHFALGVTHFWEFDDIRLLEPMPTSASFPFIFSYGQMWGVELFGRSFLGLRAFSAVLGALTVPALYLLARSLYDRPTAWAAALILVTFPPHVHYSRLGLNNIADPFFGTLALACLVHGLRSGRRRDYALAGVLLGLTQYFYDGGRVLYPALAFGWLLGGVVVWRPRPPLRGIVIAALAFGLVAAPVYYALAGMDFPVFNRLDKTALDSEEYWARDREPDNLLTRVVHFHASLSMYVNAPENTFVYYYIYYDGKHPLVLEWFVPAFMLGIGIALWRWRTPGILPVLWLLGTSLGNALLVESAVSARYVVAFPALALLIAVGLRYTLPLLWPPRWPESIQRLILAALVLTIITWQALYYFGPHLDLFNREVRLHVNYDVEDALLRAQDFAPFTEIHIIATRVLPQSDAQWFANFLADDLIVTIQAPEDVQVVDLKQLPREVDHAFFVPADEPATLATLEAVFGFYPIQTTPYDVPHGKALLLYYVPALPEALRPPAKG
jgi:hypothetical protein